MTIDEIFLDDGHVFARLQAVPFSALKSHNNVILHVGDSTTRPEML